MVNFKKRALAVMTTATVLISSTGCGKSATVFDEIESIASIEAGKFTFDVDFSTKDTGADSADSAIKAAGSGSFAENGFAITFDNLSVTSDGSDLKLDTITIELVDDTLYVPVSTASAVLNMAMSSYGDETAEPQTSVEVDGVTYSWLGLPLGDLMSEMDDDMSEEETTTPEEDINVEKMKEFGVKRVLPELEKHFGTLGKEVLFTKDGFAHFKLNNDTATAILEATKTFIQSDSFDKLMEEANTLINGEDSELEDYDTDELLDSLDELVKSITESEAKFDIDLAASSAKGTIIAKGSTSTDENNTADFSASYIVTKTKDMLTAPTDAYIGSDMYSTLLTVMG